MATATSTCPERTTVRLSPYYRGLAEKLVPEYYTTLNAAVCAGIEKEAKSKGLITNE